MIRVIQEHLSAFGGKVPPNKPSTLFACGEAVAATQTPTQAKPNGGHGPGYLRKRTRERLQVLLYSIEKGL